MIGKREYMKTGFDRTYAFRDSQGRLISSQSTSNSAKIPKSKAVAPTKSAASVSNNKSKNMIKMKKTSMTMSSTKKPTAKMAAPAKKASMMKATTKKATAMKPKTMKASTAKTSMTKTAMKKPTMMKTAAKKTATKTRR